MSKFAYKVITQEGKEKKGTIEADNEENAAIALRNEGNTVVSVGKASALSKEITIGPKKASTRDLSVFCRQFDALLRAGVGVVSALEMLADQTENKKLAESIRDVRDGVQKGDTLAFAMKKDKIFPPLLVSMVEAGESSGNLEIAFQRMAVQFEKESRLNGLIKKSLMYPIVLIVVMIAIFIVMVVKVLPSFSDMFAELETDLPAITKAMLAISDSFIHYWFVYLLVIAAIVVFVLVFKKTDVGMHFFGKIGITFPIFGKLKVKGECSRFARTFSTMLSSGMSMLEALTITSRVMQNIYFKEALQNAVVQIQRGLALSQPLRAAKIFPNLLIHMVGIGEETGNLEEMLNNCANYYDEEVEQTTQQMTALMEPIIIIVMAAMVCLLMAAIYSPLMQLYNSLG